MTEFFYGGSFGARVVLDQAQVMADCSNVRVPAEDIGRQHERDKGEYHITLLTPPEAQEVIAKSVRDLRASDSTLSKGKAEKQARDSVLAFMESAEHGISGQPKLLGLGRAISAEGHTCHFYVAEWPEAQEFRNWLGLELIQLHVTVGFSHQDLVGVDKGTSSLLGRN